MTLFAGIFSRKQGRSVPRSVCDTLHETISRDPHDERVVFEDQRSFFVKVDFGSFGGPSYKAEQNVSLTLLAGEPLLDYDHEVKCHDREKDLATIHAALSRSKFSILQKANGVFSAVNYQPDTGTVRLIVDKLGLRPLYFYIDDEYLIFASALRILEEISEIPKRMDVRAVTQMVGLGYALGERTPYADIRMLRAAEIVTISESDVSHQKYWHWDKIEPSSATEEDLLSELYRSFDYAVARRINLDKTTAAYLSGGLDSRCIVATLRSQNVRVHTFNFARPNTQDQVFGHQFASEIGATHKEMAKKAGDLMPDYSSLMAEAWATTNTSVEHPSIVWSGEGGSVALGHVHITEEIVELMREGRIDEAINEHLRRESAQVSPKIFLSHVSDDLVRSVKEEIKTELGVLNCQDPARAFYLYLLLNDQHRKLANHFENIDQHRLEFQLPFFDSAFLELIALIPIDLCLRHRLYVKWLSLFPSAVTLVPWQVYPGHQPCPVPIPNGLDYQWSANYQMTEHTARKRRIMQQASELLHSGNFPKEILNKNNLRLASWVHATGFRDYQYLIGPAHTYIVYWQKCNGKFVL
jgi:asparagine synthase (glutamine-hydrolysing)